MRIRKSRVPKSTFEWTLGFDIGPLVLLLDTLRKRGGAMLGAMKRFKLVWQSDLPYKTKLDEYGSLVVNKNIWGLPLLATLPTDFAFLEDVHARCLRRILGIPAAYISLVTNATVRDIARVESLQRRVRRTRLKLLGHILRRP